MYFEISVKFMKIWQITNSKPIQLPFFKRTLSMTARKLTKHKSLTAGDISQVIQMAWEDRTSFETIKDRTGLTEAEVICLMRAELKPQSFSMWRKRVSGRVTKHRA
jgi:uncharacterized protein (TIGR03643 family)